MIKLNAIVVLQMIVILSALSLSDESPLMSAGSGMVQFVVSGKKNHIIPL